MALLKEERASASYSDAERSLYFDKIEPIVGILDHRTRPDGIKIKVKYSPSGHLEWVPMSLLFRYPNILRDYIKYLLREHPRRVRPLINKVPELEELLHVNREGIDQ